MIQFKYYNEGAIFDASSLNNDDIAFVEDENALYTHGKKFKFVEEPEVTPSPTPLIVTYNVTDDSEPTQLYGYYAEEGEEEWWEKGVDMFTNVEIDGVDVSVETLDAAEGKYQLAAGEHIVRFTLKDPTHIGTEYGETNIIKHGAGFSQCASIIFVEIPNSVTSMYSSAFGNCSGLISVTIPNSVTGIYGTFSNCNGLTSVTIPNSVTIIGDYAFFNCRLSSVTIGSGVTSIGNNAFGSCSSLSSIISLSTTAPTIENSTFNHIKTNGTLTVPSGSSGYDVWMGTGDFYLGKYNWTKVEQ